MHLDLGADRVSENKPTDERRKAVEAGNEDPGLAALFFQCGRYLTIAGSRANSPLPLALQGIWNDGLASSMGWTDDFRLDINTQQNYWAAEVCNLSECHTPLSSLIETIRTSGRVTAHQMYGAPGWVTHVVTNPWGYSAPGWGLGWGIFVTGGVWISLQLWDHHLSTIYTQMRFSGTTITSAGVSCEPEGGGGREANDHQPHAFETMQVGDAGVDVHQRWIRRPERQREVRQTHR